MGFEMFFVIISFHARYAISCASEHSRSLMVGSHVVHRGVVEDSAMTRPTGQCIMFILRWFGDSLHFRMLWGYIGTNLPCFVYYYRPIVLWDNVVLLILSMYIVVFVISLLVNLVLKIPTHSLT